jgi:rhomboid protease GluP
MGQRPLDWNDREGISICDRGQEEPLETELDEQQPETAEEKWIPLRVELVDPTQGDKLSQRSARLWALVLDARYIECRIEQTEGGWVVEVPPAALPAALKELRLFVQENRHWPPVHPPPRPMIENTLSTLSILLLLATFHNLTALDLTIMGHHPVDWIGIGNAQAGAILDGECWRLATALTLHADWLHLLSNLAIGGIFVIFLCRDLGSGLAWSLLLASGMFGNLANAYIQLRSHSSVGSSTAVFAAVGMLGAISMVRYRNHLRKRWLLPVAAAVALLTLLGTEGKQTDLGAHLFGFVFGLGFGMLAELFIGWAGRPGRLVNALLAAASSSVLVAAWWCALRFGD